VLNSCLYNERQERETNKEGCEQFEQNECPLSQLSAKDSSWTDLSNLQRRKALSMIGSEEVLLHGEEGEENLDREGGSRATVSPMIDHEREIVELHDEAQVEQRSYLVAH